MIEKNEREAEIENEIEAIHRLQLKHQVEMHQVREEGKAIEVDRDHHPTAYDLLYFIYLLRRLKFDDN